MPEARSKDISLLGLVLAAFVRLLVFPLAAEQNALLVSSSVLLDCYLIFGSCKPVCRSMSYRTHHDPELRLPFFDVTSTVRAHHLIQVIDFVVAVP